MKRFMHFTLITGRIQINPDHIALAQYQKPYKGFGPGPARKEVLVSFSDSAHSNILVPAEQWDAEVARINRLEYGDDPAERAPGKKNSHKPNRKKKSHA